MADAMDQTSPQVIAERIRDFVRNEDISERELSRRAGFAAETYLNTLLRRMREGESLTLDSAVKLAAVMGRSLSWLATGREERGGCLFREIPGWTAACSEVLENYADVTQNALDAVGDSRWKNGPARVTTIALRDLARAYNDAMLAK